MNTLSRAITAQNFSNTTDYLNLKTQWRMLVNSRHKHELTAAHHLLYLALMGKDWRKAFTPVTNQRKLANGGFSSWGLYQAYTMVDRKIADEALLAPFGSSVTPQMLQFVRRTLGGVKLYSYPASAFTVGSFPFEAYQPLAVLNELLTTEGKVNA